MSAPTLASLRVAKGRSPLHREFGPFARLFASRFFEPIAFPEDGAQQLARLASEGEVVHVMRTSGVLGFFYLAWALLKRGLPPLRAALGLRRGLGGPFRRLYQEGPAGKRLGRALDEGASALVFLREPSAGVPRLEPQDDPLSSLVARARSARKPIYLVPELFMWRKRPRALHPADLRDMLLGSPDAQSMLAAGLSFMVHHRSAFMRLLEPLELTSFVRENAGDTDAAVVRKVRGALTQRLERETRTLVGPPRKSAARLVDETLRDRTLRASLDAVAAEGKVDRQQAGGLARRYLNQIAARYYPEVVAAVRPLVSFIFTRLHSGVEIDEAGLKRALDRGREGPLVFCPSHKSHLDYLLLAWVFAERGITPPLVAAGANLSFWPVGPILRRGGAFFLRRSFKGDKVYTATFRAYVKKLLREGRSHEFFIEGGRSRTGKLLSPKLGLVSFEVDAFLDGVQDDVIFVPIAIDYEKIPEAKSYARELAGGEKQPESLKSLLAAPKALTARYGRVYVTFDEPISLRQFLLGRAGSLDRLTGEDRRVATRALAQRITFGISRALTITPAALLSAALLGSREGRVSASEAARRIEYLRGLARADGARLSPALEGASSDPSLPGPVNETARLFMDDRNIQARVEASETWYTVPAERRSSLCFYKNNLVHLVVGRAFVATAVLAAGGRLPLEQLREAVRYLSGMLKLEFSFPVGSRFEAVVNDLVDALVREGMLERTGEEVAVAFGPRARADLRFSSDLIADLLESYRLVAQAVARVEAPVEKKELLKTALDQGREGLAQGKVRFAEAISRPNFENALALFVAQGVLVESSDGRRVSLAEGQRQAPLAAAERLEALGGLRL